MFQVLPGGRLGLHVVCMEWRYIVLVTVVSVVDHKRSEKRGIGEGWLEGRAA